MNILKTPSSERADIVRLAPNFAGLAVAGARALAEVGSVREYAEGEYLFQQDEEAAGFPAEVAEVLLRIAQRDALGIPACHVAGEVA